MEQPTYFLFKNFNMNKQQNHNFQAVVILIVVFLVTAYLENI